MSAEQSDSIAAAAEGALAGISSNPKFQSILQKHIEAYKAANSEEVLTKPVRNRVNALKNLQVDVLKLEANFYKEVQELEVKYQALYQPLLNKRAEIVSGSLEPSEEECKWAYSDDEDKEEEDGVDEEDSKAKKDEDKQAEDDKENEETKDSTDKEQSDQTTEETINGIPNFWLKALRNTGHLCDLIYEHDEPLLACLRDIKVVYDGSDGLSFNLEFHFAENDFFVNKVLTKSYVMSCEVPSEDPFEFEGATITSCKGCKIDWKKGKNVTVKTIKKKQKHKGKGQSRVVTKTVSNDSFFHFFTPPDFESAKKSAEEDEDEIEEIALKLEADFRIAEFLRDRFIPKAVLFFTGELTDDDDEDDLVDDENGSDDEDEDNEVNTATPPECKSQ